MPRTVEVKDCTSDRAVAALKKPARDKADLGNPGSVAAPMSGEVVEVKAAPGARVAAGQALVVMSAMKMETAVAAATSGIVSHVYAIKGDQLETGDLLLLIKPDGGDTAAAADGSGAAAAGAAL